MIPIIVMGVLCLISAVVLRVIKIEDSIDRVNYWSCLSGAAFAACLFTVGMLIIDRDTGATVVETPGGAFLWFYILLSLLMCAIAIFWCVRVVKKILKIETRA